MNETETTYPEDYQEMKDLLKKLTEENEKLKETKQNKENEKDERMKEYKERKEYDNQMARERKAKEEKRENLKKAVKQYNGEPDATVLNAFKRSMEAVIGDMADEKDPEVATTFLRAMLGTELDVWYTAKMNQTITLNAADMLTELYNDHYPTNDILKAEHELETIRQGNETLDDHIRKFGKLINRIPRAQLIHEKQKQLRWFLRSIRGDIGGPLLAHHLATESVTECWSLEEVYSKSRRMDQELGDLLPKRKTADITINEMVANQDSTTEEELQVERREQGACFKCGQQGHIARGCRLGQKRYGSNKGSPEPRKRFKRNFTNNFSRVDQLVKKLETLVETKIRSTEVNGLSVPANSLERRQPIWEWLAEDRTVSLNKVDLAEKHVSISNTFKHSYVLSMTHMQTALASYDTRPEPWLIRKENIKEKMARQEITNASILALDHLSCISEEPFLFNGLVSNTEATEVHKQIVLVDTGCTAMVIGRPIVDKLKLKMEQVSPIRVKYADERTSVIDQEVKVILRVGSYVRQMRFLVGNIGDSMILGAPWIKTIRFKELDWFQGCFRFQEHHRATIYSWTPTWQAENKVQVERPLAAKIAFLGHQQVQRDIAKAQYAYVISLQRVQKGKAGSPSDSPEKKAGSPRDSPEKKAGSPNDSPEEKAGSPGDSPERLQRTPNETGVGTEDLAETPNVPGARGKVNLDDSHHLIDEEEETDSSKIEREFEEEIKRIRTEDKQLAELLYEFRSVFASPKDLPPSRPEDLVIRIRPGAKEPRQKGQGKMSLAELKILKEKIADLLDRGFIQHSTSSMASSLLFVKKADGGLRMCVDYRGLNDITEKDKSPIPNLSEIRGSLRTAKHFSKFDLRDGYYNLRVAPESVEKTAFKCRYGHFEFRVVPFGLTNAPAVFSSMMNRILQPLLDSCAIAYIDDVVMYSDTIEEHYKHLRQVLTLFKDNCLFLKLSKCEFNKPDVMFCGHRIGHTGMFIAPEKIEAMRTIPDIKNVRDIQSFLGSCVWFQEFIPDYANLTFPLTQLLHKDSKWIWTDEHRSAVQMLIYLITTAPVLKFFDEKLDTRVFTDASDYAIGGWIAQLHTDGWHPVCFWSRKLRPAEMNYFVYEKELLALVAFLNKYGYLLHGVKFTSFTDHKSLIWLQDKQNLSGRLARWIIILQEFDFVLYYVEGSLNNVADFLSRSPLVQPLCLKCGSEIHIGSLVTGGKESSANNKRECFQVRLRDQYGSDREILQFKSWLGNPKLLNAKRKDQLQGLTIRNGLMYFQHTRLLVPAALRTELLERYHDHPTAGHQGVKRSLLRLQRYFYWPGMHRDVQQFVRSCDTCQRCHISTDKPSGYLHPLPVPSDRFTQIGIDFAIMDVTSNGFDAVMVMVDHLTKLICLIPCERTINTTDMASLFFQNWFCSGKGMPERIVTDRDSKFTNELWKALCDIVGIEQAMATARHQQTDGSAEHVIKMMKFMLKKYATYNGDTWAKQLPFIEFSLNSSISSTTGFSPFYLAYGYEPDSMIGDWLYKDTDQHSLLYTLQRNLAAARDSSEEVKVAQSRYYDNKHREAPNFDVGDRVMLKAEGINIAVYENRPKHTLPRYLGPFTIIAFEEYEDDWSGLNFKLALPASMSQVHPIFHVSQLRRYEDPGEWFKDRTSLPTV